MREILVSTAVFAGIWANRLDGEDSEDEILQRLLNSNSTAPISGVKSNIVEKKALEGDGVYDRRNGVHFPEGTQIFRIYKGKRYVATAQSGQWVRQDSQETFPSLNQLNVSISAGSENVWNGTWKFVKNNKEQSIDVFRKQQRSV